MKKIRILVFALLFIFCFCSCEKGDTHDGNVISDKSKNTEQEEVVDLTVQDNSKEDKEDESDDTEDKSVSIEESEKFLYAKPYLADGKYAKGEILYLSSMVSDALKAVTGQTKCIVLCDGVEVIPEDFFSELENIERFVLPDSITIIGEAAFKKCSALEQINFPKKLRVIDEWAFLSCESLKSIVLPDGITEIAYNAFMDCYSIEEIHISAGVSQLGTYTYNEKPALKRITVDDQNKHYSVDENGVLFNKEKTKLIVFPAKSELEEYVIPSGVTEIEQCAFYYCHNLKKLVLSDVSFEDCWEMDYFAYMDSIEELHLSKNEKSFINGFFFEGGSEIAESLKKVTVDDDHVYLTVDEHGVLFNKEKTILMLCPPSSGLVSYTIPEGVEDIYEGAFSNCKTLESIVIPDSVTTIPDYAFDYCTSLKNVEFPGNLTMIHSYAFRGCTELENLILPDSVTGIADCAFAGCTGLKTARLSKQMDTIADRAFAGCTELKEIIFGKELETIGWNAFSGCTSLTTLELPDWLSYIGGYAFSECTSLKEIAVPHSVENVLSGTFEGCTALEKVEWNGKMYIVDKNGNLIENT